MTAATPQLPLESRKPFLLANHADLTSPPPHRHHPEQRVPHATRVLVCGTPEDASVLNGQWNNRHTQEIARGEAQFREDLPPQPN